MVFGAVVGSSTSQAEVPGEDFEKAFDAFLEQECPLEPVANATLKDLLKEYKRVMAVAPEDAFVKKVARACFLEGASGKLGVPSCTSVKIGLEEMRSLQRKEIVADVCKSMEKTARRSSSITPDSTAAAVWQAHLEIRQAEKDAASSSKVLTENEGEGAAVVPADAPGTPGSKASDEVAVVAAGLLGEPGAAPVDLKVGQVVKTLPIMKKKEHRCLRAVITRVLSGHYWIRFEEGGVEVKGESVKAIKKNVALIEEGATPELAVPAGQKGPAVGKTQASSADESPAAELAAKKAKAAAEELAAKKAKAEEEADALFGLEC